MPLPVKDPFKLHKISLRPLLRALSAEEVKALFKELESVDQNEFITFLYRQGLAQMWLAFLLKQESVPAEFEETMQALKKNAIAIAADQLMQQFILAETRNTFEKAGIKYLVFKGANLRHTIYADPTHRTVCDIDILIRDEQKPEAIRSLEKAGFSAHHTAENISHETSLTKKHVNIDLHWHLMRPGRTRIDLNDYLFDQRQAYGGFQGLSNQASLLVMLIHPAITKYVNGHASSLHHLVDIHRLAQSEDINWEALIEMLSRSGTKTAAWASLTWLNMLADKPVYEDLANQLRPGGLKARWLSCWLRNNLNVKLAERKLILRACFSLALQDNAKDTFNALMTLALTLKR